jgi:hypothetical protein
VRTCTAECVRGKMVEIQRIAATLAVGVVG